MLSIVRGVVEKEEEPDGLYTMVYFPHLIPPDESRLPWLLCHEISHVVQHELIGIDTNPQPVWPKREHEIFANLFADMLLRRIGLE